MNFMSKNTLSLTLVLFLFFPSEVENAMGIVSRKKRNGFWFETQRARGGCLQVVEKGKIEEAIKEDLQHDR